MRPADLAIIHRVHFWQLSQAQMLLSQHCMLNSHAHGVLQDDSNVIMQSICYCHILVWRLSQSKHTWTVQANLAWKCSNANELCNCVCHKGWVAGMTHMGGCWLKSTMTIRACGRHAERQLRRPERQSSLGWYWAPWGDRATPGFWITFRASWGRRTSTSLWYAFHILGSPV